MATPLVPVIVDISHYDVMQTDGFGKLARAGYKGVIHKATEGPGLLDLPYTSRRRDCVDAGLAWGCYHFARRGDGAAQADHFLAHAQPDASTLIALDWESAKKDYSDTFTCAQARAFLDRVMEKTGRKPQDIYIYGGNVLKELITSPADMAYFGQFRLWLCQYTSRPRLPKAWSAYTIWQFSGDGVGPGPHSAAGVSIAGGVDQNIVADGFDFERDWGAAKPVESTEKIGIADLVAVSRKANGTLWFKRVWKGFSVAGVLSGLGMAKDTSDQVGQIIAEHWLAILITATILVVLFIKWLEGLMVEDTNEGRYTPSGANAA